jgi:dTDP-4-dehydrorhamnose reductase
MAAGPIPPRAGDVTLDSSKLADSLGCEPFDPWPLDEALVPTDRDWHRRRRTDDPGSPEYLHRTLCVNAARRSP